MTLRYLQKPITVLGNKLIFRYWYCYCSLFFTFLREGAEFKHFFLLSKLMELLSVQLFYHPNIRSSLTQYFLTAACVIPLVEIYEMMFFIFDVYTPKYIWCDA